MVIYKNLNYVTRYYQVSTNAYFIRIFSLYNEYQIQCDSVT